MEHADGSTSHAAGAVDRRHRAALWQIVLLGLVAGARLPALFALGLRALALPGRGGRTAPADSDQVVGGNPLGLTVAVVCLAVVLAAIGWGIWAIYEAGH